MKLPIDVGTTFKTFITLASAYVFGFGLLFGWGYWSTFSVDFLSYVSLADVIRMALLPMAQVMIFVFCNSLAIAIAATLAMSPSASTGETIVVPTIPRTASDPVKKFKSFLLVALPTIGIIAAFPAGCLHAASVTKEGMCVQPKTSPQHGCYRFEGVLGGTYFFLTPNGQTTLVLAVADALPLEIPITEQKPWWTFPDRGGGPGPPPPEESGGPH